MKNSYSDEQFIEAVKTSFSKAQVLKTLGLKPCGGNYQTFDKNVKRLNLDTSHFTGKGWNTGTRYRPVREKISMDQILVKNSSWTNTNHLRERLLKEGFKEWRCECCKNTEWLGKPIALELHHINGIKDDLRIENLQVLCPNCHAFTDNYRGKGMSTSVGNSEVNAG